MTVFHLEILTPERPFYVGDCVSVVLPVSDGMLGIMANHSPLTAAISGGEVSFTLPEGEKRICAVGQGMVNVADNRVMLLCETALLPNEISEAKENRRLAYAQQQLRMQQSRKEYQLTQMALTRAMNNLRVKRNNQINQ